MPDILIRLAALREEFPSIFHLGKDADNGDLLLYVNRRELGRAACNRGVSEKNAIFRIKSFISRIGDVIRTTLITDPTFVGWSVIRVFLDEEKAKLYYAKNRKVDYDIFRPQVKVEGVSGSGGGGGNQGNVTSGSAPKRVYSRLPPLTNAPQILAADEEEKLWEMFPRSTKAGLALFELKQAHPQAVHLTLSPDDDGFILLVHHAALATGLQEKRGLDEFSAAKEVRDVVSACRQSLKLKARGRGLNKSSVSVYSIPLVRKENSDGRKKRQKKQAALKIPLVGAGTGGDAGGQGETNGQQTDGLVDPEKDNHDENNQNGKEFDVSKKREREQYLFSNGVIEKNAPFTSPDRPLLAIERKCWKGENMRIVVLLHS